MGNVKNNELLCLTAIANMAVAVYLQKKKKLNWKRRTSFIFLVRLIFYKKKKKSLDTK